MAEASTNGTGELAFPTRIPTGGLVLPCGGALIGDLRPAQLALLLGKVAALVHAEGARWNPAPGSPPSGTGHPVGPRAYATPGRHRGGGGPGRLAAGPLGPVRCAGSMWCWRGSRGGDAAGGAARGWYGGADPGGGRPRRIP